MNKIKKIKIGLGITVGLTALAVLIGVAGAMFPPGFNNVIWPDKSRGYEAVSGYNSNFGEVGPFAQDEITVKFKGDAEPFRVIKITGGNVGEKIKEYSKRADVVYAEPNYIAYALMAPNDTNYKYQWHLDNPVYGGIGMEEAWDISTGAGVTVAVVDTGIRKGTDLANTCFVAGYDFVNSDTDPTDDNGHGTHVAGTVAQSTNNDLGVAGVAFGSCLMPVQVLNSQGSGTYANVALGIRYAADHGAKIINLSLGGSASDITLGDAVAYAYGKGVTIIAACGNENTGSCFYPAAYDDYVIAVGATQYDEARAPYSNYGPSLDLAAPGGNNNLDQNGDGYADGVLQQTFTKTSRTISWGYYFFQGTSMAAPHISGVAALLLANGNATTPAQIRTALQSTAEDKGTPGRDDTYGYGLVDAFAALKWTAGPDNNPPIANAGSDQSAIVNTIVTLDGSGSTDNIGITSYKWDFDASNGVDWNVPDATGVSAAASYSAVGIYTVILQVSDAAGLTATDTALITVTETPVEVTVFSDSFEDGNLGPEWTQDAQNDWFVSTQRAVDGARSAEVDGLASNAKLISAPIDLQGRTNASITFSWFIESGLDKGEYLAFDVSTDGGNSWVEKARLRGNIDPENSWQGAAIDLTDISQLKIQFRGKMSGSDEDADVDMVRVVAR